MDNQSHPIDAPHNNVNIDNEMLFDFDIGSPQTPDETSSFENIIHDIELDSLNITYSNSDRFLQNISSVGESTSSGLFSEPFTPSPSEKGNFSGDYYFYNVEDFSQVGVKIKSLVSVYRLG